MLEMISNDLFKIAARLKSINSNYVVFRNMATGRVEVHSKARPCTRSLEFIVPYESLDERTLEYAHKTRIENFDNIEQNQAKDNAEIKRSAGRSADQSLAVLSDMMKFAGSQVNKIVFKKDRHWF